MRAGADQGSKREGFNPGLRPEEAVTVFVDFEKKGGIPYIALDRPERPNALGSELMADLRKAEAGFAQDDDLQVAICTGGRAFCSGRDLKETAENGARPGPLGGRTAMRTAITHCKLTIAAMNRLAYGGGAEMALGCDIRICSEKARFALSEAKLARTPLRASRTCRVSSGWAMRC